ncbi:MAG: DUF5666 domain-containing protein [Chloroflexota bacterium]
MIRRTWIPLVLVLALSLSLPGVAMASTEQPIGEQQGGRRSIGQVIEVTGGQITIQTRGGEEMTFGLDENTRYRTLAGGEASSDDMAIGRWVAVLAVQNESGVAVARVIVLFPEDFDPSQRFGRLAGEIQAIDQTAKTFILGTPDGREVTVVVSERTRYVRGVQSFDELEVGMKVLVVGKYQEDGSFLALGVGARLRPSLERHIGEISAVDSAGGSFTLRTAAGEELHVLVDEKTRYVGVQGLEELQVGMKALVVCRQEEGGLLALGVGARAPRLKVEGYIGRVTSVDLERGTFNLLTRNGEEITFTVSERTRFRSRDGSVQGLGDLQPEMGVLVIARPQEDGGLLALFVGAAASNVLP